MSLGCRELEHLIHCSPVSMDVWLEAIGESGSEEHLRHFATFVLLGSFPELLLE